MGIVQDIKKERWILTQEGLQYAEAGSPEVQLFSAIPNEGITQEDLQVRNFFLFGFPWEIVGLSGCIAFELYCIGDYVINIIFPPPPPSSLFCIKFPGATFLIL